MRVVFRHALELAVMKDDPQEAASQLFRSMGGDRELLVAAHDHYSEILAASPDDEAARKALTMVEWALTGDGGPVVVRAKNASTTR